MSFNDLPIVDRFAQNSDLAEKQLESCLNMQAGFICRPDVPDKSCDYDIELILEGKNASNWRFALQLKSIEKRLTVNEKGFVAYPFETSRLGYLLRRQPAMGIIVIYDIDKKLLYFDFADKIYTRLLDERDNEDWKKNETVSIHIPANNILNEQSRKDVHTIFTRRFDRAAQMQLSHGEKYDLPAINLTGEYTYDFNNIEHVKKLLKESGLWLLGGHDLQMIFDLIVRVPNLEICANKDLLMIAAIAYGETGKHTDSSFYISKLFKRSDLTVADRQMIEFARLKNDLALGNIDEIAFIKTARDMLERCNDARNQVCFEINITFFEMLAIKPLTPVPVHLIKSVESVSEKVNLLPENGIVNHLLQLWNADNFNILISHFRSRLFGEFRMRESLGGSFSLAEKKERILFITGLQNKFLNLLDG